MHPQSVVDETNSVKVDLHSNPTRLQDSLVI